MRIWMVLMFVVMLMLSVSGCGGAQSSTAAEGKEETMAAFQRVASDEAQRMMAENTNYIILDVRTAGEYAGGHIQHAINVPNESITTAPPKELPDKDQMIFVYCRSGARSQQAAQNLATMGYTHIVEMGGINNWHGDVVK